MDTLLGGLRDYEALAMLASGPITVTDLADRLDLTRPGAHKLLRRLEEAGLVDRSLQKRWHEYELRTNPVTLERQVLVRPFLANVRLVVSFSRVQADAGTPPIQVPTA